jgi:hypothetical protein
VLEDEFFLAPPEFSSKELAAIGKYFRWVLRTRDPVATFKAISGPRRGGRNISSETYELAWKVVFDMIEHGCDADEAITLGLDRDQSDAVSNLVNKNREFWEGLREAARRIPSLDYVEAEVSKISRSSPDFSALPEELRAFVRGEPAIKSWLMGYARSLRAANLDGD